MMAAGLRLSLLVSFSLGLVLEAVSIALRLAVAEFAARVVASDSNSFTIH